MNKNLLVFLGILLASSSLWSQVDSGSLNGTVTDSGGGLVPHANVAIRNVDKGVERSTLSARSGTYSASTLAAGHYAITVTALGFSTKKVTDIVLKAGETKTMMCAWMRRAPPYRSRLHPTPAGLRKSSVELGSNIESSEISNIPMNGRHYANLMALAPGAINTGSGDQKSIRFLGHSKDDVN